MKLTVFIVAMIFFPSWGVAGWFGPSTYEECVLENMKGVTSNQAAVIIAKACREKFPEKNYDPYEALGVKREPVRSLSPKEVALLSIRSTDYDSFGNSYNCNVYNGNNNVAVSSILVNIPDKNGIKRYSVNVNVTISPQSINSVSIKVMPESSYSDSWKITEATGTGGPGE